MSPEAEQEQQRDQQQEPDGPGQSRLKLIWDVIVFQFKLAADGLRDVALVPVSILAALFGLLTSRSDPGRHYRAVLRLGRRTEVWINLFGYRKHAQTSDALIKPIEERVFKEAQENPWLKKAGDTFNRSIDAVNESVEDKAN